MSKKPLEVPKMRGVEDLLTMDMEATKSATVAIHKIRVSSQQPRRWFDPHKMAQLVQSVREHGILEPLLVRPVGNGEYEIVAGERRLRAAQEVELAEVPIISKELTDQQAVQIALIENLQREDLNPVEETEGILKLLSIELEISEEEVVAILNQAANVKKRGGVLTENVSRQLQQIELLLTNVGKFNAESFRTSRVPLLNLPDEVLEILRQGKLEYTKARVIARVKNQQQRADLLTKSINENLSLSEIKELVKNLQLPETTQILSEKYFSIGKRLKSARVWEDAKKHKRLEKLLAEIEQLLD